jgi:hypothetical protein
MSCGLGAVILLFFLLDFDEPVVLEIVEQVFRPSVDFPALETQKAELEKLIALKSQSVSLLVEDISTALIQSATNSVLLDEKTRIMEMKELTSAPIISDAAASGELIGLSISGQRILVLFDVSASMAEESLIKIIIGISDKSGARLSAGPKWHQAKRIVTWVLENIPSGSNVQMLTYSDRVASATKGWLSSVEALEQFKRKQANLSPNGGTSLGRVLEYIQENRIRATDIYVITDGLPTLSGDKSSGLGAIKSCFKLPSKKPTYVEGICREALFTAAVARFSKESKAKVNVILLPLEGDPKAAPYYWGWADATGGTLLSPARNWP